MISESAIEFKVETVTPEEANRFIERFYSKTKIDQRLLQAYSRDMRSGRWVMNGAPIVFTDDGQVIDGRARLLACVHSGAAFDTLIVRGISANSYETIDSVRKRTLADVLSIRQERHGRSLAAALRIIWAYTNGLFPSGARSPSPISLLSILEERPEIRDSIMPSLVAAPLLPHGCGIALHYLMGLIDQQKADRFVALIGEPISNGDVSPILQLRQILSELKGQGGSRKQSYILAIAIKAWNAFYTGKPLRQLKYSPDTETFPQILGIKDSAGPLFDYVRQDKLASSHGFRFPAYSSVSAKVVIITPEKADEILSKNKLNRSISASVVNKYARDMISGRWLLNGQTIKISKDGKLLDGQHRLEASKKAKKGFPAIIVEGLSEETFSSLDIGHRRSVSDILRERGENNTIVLASALRWLWMVRNNVVLAANSSPTNGELLALLEECPQIRKSLKHVIHIGKIMGAGIATALHYTFKEKDHDKADEFFSRLIDGVHLSESSPIYHLRERLIRTRSSHRVRLAEAERVALAIKSWNAFREDRSIQLLAWRNRGATREALPIPV